MTSDSKNKSLIAAVRKFKSNSMASSKSSLLDNHAGDLAVLVDEGVVLGDIHRGLEEVGVIVSRTYLQGYLKSNFPESYKKNYTDRLKGGRKVGSRNKPKPNPEKGINDAIVENEPSKDCQQSDSKGVVSDKAHKYGAFSENISETSLMVADYLDENKDSN